MNLVSILAIAISELLSHQPPEPNREQRVEVLATAESRAVERATCTGEAASETCKPIMSDTPLAAALLYTTGKFESDYKYRIHAAECRRYECDPHVKRIGGVAHVEHAAHGPWQTHCTPAMTAEQCAAQDGLTQEATDLAAWRAMKLLAGAYGVCGTVEGALTMYATGKSCRSALFEPQAKKRAVYVARTRTRIVRMLATKTEQETKGIAGR